MIILETNMGEIHITVDAEKAPITAKNFTDYVEEGFFDGTIFHRVIPNFMIQGGGCLLYTSPSPRDRTRSRMPSSA